MEFSYSFEEDQYDRYKVLSPIIQKHKRYFFIQNLQKVADNLQVQATYLVKFICIKSNCTYEIYQKSNYLIKASLTQIQVEVIINEFIESYLKCHKCHLLEYKIKVNKDKGVVQSKCASCGAFKNHSQDSEMTQYILSNPPIVKKKHEIEIGRGFLNDLNQDYDFSDDDEEERHYSYEFSDEEEEGKVDQDTSSEEETQEDQSDSISFEEDEQFEEEEEEEKNIDEYDTAFNKNSNEEQETASEDESNEYHTTSHHTQGVANNLQSQEIENYQKEIVNIIQTNQQKFFGASQSVQYHTNSLLIEQKVQ